MKAMLSLMAAVWASQVCMALAAEDQTNDELRQYKEIQQHLNKQEWDEADKALDLALDAHPDSARLNYVHYIMSVYLSRGGRMTEAGAHAEAYVDYRLSLIAKNPATARGLANAVNAMTSAYQGAGKPGEALQKLDEKIAKLESFKTDKPSSPLNELLVQLQGRKAILLAESGKREEAEQLLADQYDAAKKAFDAEPDDDSVLALASVLGVRADFAAVAAPEKAEAARQEQLDFLAEQVKSHTDSAPIVSAYVGANVTILNGLARSDAAKAEEQLKAVEEVLSAIESEDDGVKSAIRNATRTLSSLKARIAAALLRQNLIGQQSLPLEADAWVNGEELSEADLKGKVVLLDFWAVWCGPCIATFPHLREWRDKYSEKGLVIIGVTRYYSRDWDEEVQRSKRVEDLSPSDEQAAMVKFAEHHQLKHRFAVTSAESKLSEQYGVTGIPQAVLIDREGRIRMIRVGSGEENARDLEQMIGELIATDADKASG